MCGFVYGLNLMLEDPIDEYKDVWVSEFGLLEDG